MKKLTSKFPGLKVLLVEDNLLNQEVAQELLELMGCTVDCANDGPTGLEKALKNEYEIILMDLQIPGIEGLEVTRQILQKNTKAKPPVIVALTASALDGDREKCIQAGMDDYISKPMEGEKLEEILLKYFSAQKTSI